MAFKLLNQVPEEQKCAICDTRYNTEFSDSYQIYLCDFHGLMTGNGLAAVLMCKQHPPDCEIQISKAQFYAGRWNSYDRDTMLPYFSNELLIEQAEYTLKNCSRIGSPARTYDEALQLYAAQLTKRLKEKTQ